MNILINYLYVKSTITLILEESSNENCLFRTHSFQKLNYLCKNHKADKFMRPIVSALGPPTYNLDKRLTKEFKS